MPRSLLARIFFIIISITLFIGCSSSDKKENNTAFLDGNGNRGGFFSANSKRNPMLRNPDLSIPVDPNLARSLTYSRISTQAPFVAMTFDDGPHPVHTPRLLDILKAPGK